MRIQHQIRAGSLQGFFIRTQGRQHLQSGDNAVTRGVPVKTNHVAGIFPPQQPSVRLHHLQHITVAHLGAAERDAEPGQRMLKTQITHQGTRHARYFGRAREVACDHVKQTIAIINPACGIDHDQTVAIAIQCNPRIGLVRQHGFAHRLRRCCPHVIVDIQAIRHVANADYFSTQLMEHLGRHLIRCTMGTIDD